MAPGQVNPVIIYFFANIILSKAAITREALDAFGEFRLIINIHIMWKPDDKDSLLFLK